MAVKVKEEIVCSGCNVPTEKTSASSMFTATINPEAVDTQFLEYTVTCLGKVH